MRIELRVQRIGDSLGLILPDEVLLRMGVHAGDAVMLNEACDGAYLMSSQDSGASVQIAESVISRYKNTLRDLS